MGGGTVDFAVYTGDIVAKKRSRREWEPSPQARVSDLPVAFLAECSDNKVMAETTHPLAELLRRDRRYHFDAYVFVFEALRYAQQNTAAAGTRLGASSDDDFDPDEEEERHVTGQQLCEAIRHYAVQQYGLLAKRVLNHWGIHSTGDFGEIVFSLIDIGQMRKTDTDRREDFDDVFDFDEGLRDAFVPLTSDSREERRP